MLFSVVVPVKNAQRELPDCILSVLRQPFRDFELILVYSPSKDDSFDCCRRFANIESRIRIVKTDGETAFAAKKIGVEEAQGEYVTVLYPDGKMGEDLLSAAKDAIGKESADLVAYPKTRPDASADLPDHSYVEDKDELRALLLSRTGINKHFVGFFAKKDLYLTAMSYYHEGIAADEDDLLVFAAIARAKGIRFFAEGGGYAYLGKTYFPRPHGWTRIESEEILFQRLNAVADESDCSFVRDNIALHAFFVTEKELLLLAQNGKKEEFYDAFLRVTNSAYYYALKRKEYVGLKKTERRLLKALVKKRRRLAFWLLRRRPSRRKG
ncbi:MAG: glycosyltransferase family 2 protein [Clostridia bacterium]|nr:glycosyltransferase family 2 protein [Clostridia bacterium]